MSWSAAGVVDSPWPLEAVTPQPLCTLDGWQYHLPLPHHDGRHDVHSTCPDSLLLQRWYDSQYSHYEHILCQLLNATHVFSPSLFPPFPLIFSPVFHKLQGDQALLQKVVYVLANLVGVGLAVYKFNNMGLLPTAQSDWLEFMEARQVSTALRFYTSYHDPLIAVSVTSFLSPSGFGNVGRRISTCMTVHLCLYITKYCYVQFTARRANLVPTVLPVHCSQG